jgi:hypothetical protein
MIPGTTCVWCSYLQHEQILLNVHLNVEECSSKLAAFKVHTRMYSRTVLANKIFNWQHGWPKRDCRPMLFRGGRAALSADTMCQ